MVRTLSLLLLLFLTGAVNGQQARQYSFKHFSVSNGLVSNNVSTTLQDADGFIWFATLNGLQRYDGNSFITFNGQPGDGSGIPSARLLHLFLDKENTVWMMGDNHRVGRFNTRTFRFHAVELPTNVFNDDFDRFYQLPTGELLLLAGGRVYRYDRPGDRFVAERTRVRAPEGWHINGISWEAGRGVYWISADSGLAQYVPATGRLNYRQHNPDKVTEIDAFASARWCTNAFADRKGNFNFAFWPAGSSEPVIGRFNRAAGKPELVRLSPTLGGYHEIIDFFEQSNGRLWIHGMPFFLEWTSDPGRPFLPLSGENLDEPKIKFDYAYNAFEDREHNIWISTDNGVYLFNPDAQVFNTYGLMRPGDKAPYERPVNSVLQLKNGNILVGTWGSSGLYLFDKHFRPLPLPSAFGQAGKTYTVWDMAVSGKSGKVWITLQGGGLVVYDPAQNTAQEMYPGIFNRSTIRQIDDDTSGNMWFGTHNGKLIKWDCRKAGDDPSKGFELVYETGLIHKVHYDYQGFIWVGTISRGLVKIDARTNRVVKVFSPAGPAGERLFTSTVSDMTYYNDSTLLVGAGCINILNTRTDKISYLSTADGLPSNTVESLERDDKGIVWAGMTNGICRVNLQKRLVSFYDRRDGIAYDKFNKAGVQELKDGRLIFFSDHNFLAFNPESFGQQNPPPTPVVTAITLGSRSLSIDSLLRAGRLFTTYDNTSIGIDFSAMSFQQATKQHFFYMLEGVDLDWIHTDKPIRAIYNHLKPGAYVFRLKSENADGVTSVNAFTFPLTVRPPFWNTWWFYGLVLLLIITILYVIDKERMNKKDSLRSMRRQIAGNLHTEISNTLNNINVLSEIAKIKADKNVEQSKEFITQISTKSRYMIEVMDDMLWSIDPQNDSMRKTVLRIKELTEGLRTTHAVDIDLIVDHKVQALELDMKFRMDLFFYYKDALLLLLEQAQVDQVFVNINQVRSRLMVEVIAECSYISPVCAERFEKLLGRRAAGMHASLDVLADAHSFSAVLYADI